MSDDQPTFARTMETAAGICREVLFPAAVERGDEGLLDVLDILSEPKTRACLIWAVLLDRERQRPVAKLRFTVDVAALDALAAAAEHGVAELRDAARELPIETATAALGELICLHRGIAATEAAAASAAALN